MEPIKGTANIYPTQEINWTTTHEEILKEWKAKCFVHLWLQDASAYYYIKMYNWLSYPVIILTSLSSVALFSSDNQVLKYFASTMTLVSGILTAITRHYKPGELHQQHALTTRRYNNLIRCIDTCLSLTFNMRQPPSIFIERIGCDIDNLASNQIDPPIHVKRNFERKYGTIDRMLYGEDIVELVKIEMEANKMFRRIKKNNRLSDDNFTTQMVYPQVDKTSIENSNFYRSSVEKMVNNPITNKLFPLTSEKGSLCIDINTLVRKEEKHDK